MNSVRLVADDLTGALDGGSPFAGRGLASALFVPASCAKGADTPRVLVASTDSRRLPAPLARHRVGELLRSLPRDADALLVKKIDSLLRGPYAAELDELMRVTGRRVAVICPALPRLGRVLVAGRLYDGDAEVADGQRIAGEVSSALGSALSAALPEVPLWAGDVATLPAQCEAGLLVADARTDADLDRLVDRFWARRHQLVWVGSSGLTLALARRLVPCAGSGGRVPEPEAPARPLLLVVGSRTARTRAEIGALLEQDGWVRDGAGPAPGPGVRRARRPQATLLLTPEEDIDSGEATAMLAAAALRELDAGQVGSLAVVGGETLAALMAGLAPTRVRVLGPAAAGFEAMAVSGARVAGELRVYSRSGSFGRPGDLWGLCSPAAGQVPARGG